MPQSLALVIVHVIFSTKDRQPLLESLARQTLPRASWELIVVADTPEHDAPLERRIASYRAIVE